MPGRPPRPWGAKRHRRKLGACGRCPPVHPPWMEEPGEPDHEANPAAPSFASSSQPPPSMLK